MDAIRDAPLMHRGKGCRSALVRPVTASVRKCDRRMQRIKRRTDMKYIFTALLIVGGIPSFCQGTD